MILYDSEVLFPLKVKEPTWRNQVKQVTLFNNHMIHSLSLLIMENKDNVKCCKYEQHIQSYKINYIHFQGRKHAVKRT